MPYQADIIRHKKVSASDLHEGEYIINEFGGEVKGVLKLNGKLHTTLFSEQTNKAPLKSESNLVINDGMSNRVIIGDIGKTKDGMLYGMKVSTPGHDARFAPKENLLVDTSQSIKIEYRFICHNFTRDIIATEYYLPWFNNSLEDTDMNHASRSLLAPYKMTLYKLYMRPETLSDTSADFTFALDKQDDGDTTVDSVATVTYTTSLASDTMITINKSDWNNVPTVEAGDKIGLSIQANKDASGTIDWFITSVWQVEVVL